MLSGSLFGQLQLIEEDSGVTGFGLALRKLPTVGSVLYITAHPDDEDNALMAEMSRGDGYRTGLMSLTRGDGGQNEIGPELFEQIGVLRSEELMSMHRWDGAQQFFSRAFEFGYSFSVEETLQKWGREEILEDIVRVIRQFRPWIILSLNPGGPGGGQHHQASAQLAAEAFRLAGDPGQFPNQIEEGLRPWRPYRLFQAMGPGMGRMGSGGDVRIDLSGYDPLLGETYAEFGARARSNHRSQGMNVLPRPGPWFATFFLANSTVDSFDIKDSFFDQIDVSLQALSALDPELDSSVILLDGYVNWANEAFSRSDYPSAVKAVMTGLDYVRRMRSTTNNPEVQFLLDQKEKDFLAAAERGHFVTFNVFARSGSDGLVVPGEEVEVEVHFYNRSKIPLTVESTDLMMPDGWEIVEQRTLDHSTVFKVRVPDDAPVSKPYWFRDNPQVDRFSVNDGMTGTEPYSPPPIRARVQYRSQGVDASVEAPAVFRWFDAAFGIERRAELSVVPKLSVGVEPSIAVIRQGSAEPKQFKVRVRSSFAGPVSATLRLEVPAGWTVSPASSVLSFSYENETRTAGFTVRPSARAKAGDYQVEASAEVDGRTYRAGFHPIDYSHIQTRYFYSPATAQVAVMNVSVAPQLKVGYVMGVGDEVGIATEQLGASVTYLTEDDLSSGDLSVYDTIVTGVRAYLNREDLISNNQRLLDYVRAGGNLVVQYNKYEFLRAQFAPYPLDIGRPHDRVTVEESPVEVLIPSHKLLTSPNRIEEKDWEGWVQERGLYFLGTWDERYTPLLELKDPWPYNADPKRGALVVADYGKGTYVYTGLAFFRQLPAGVPGAYRLWANLISAGK